MENVATVSAEWIIRLWGPNDLKIITMIQLLVKNVSQYSISVISCGSLFENEKSFPQKDGLSKCDLPGHVVDIEWTPPECCECYKKLECEWPISWITGGEVSTLPSSDSSPAELCPVRPVFANWDKCELSVLSTLLRG